MPRVKTFDEHQALRKATELFWKKGYNATSVNDLVEHLGLSRSSLYDTFGDKHDLFEKAFAQYRTENRANLEVFLGSQSSVKAGFENLFVSAIEKSLADPDHKGCMMVNTTTELVPGDERIREILKSNRDEVVQIFEAFIQRGLDSGELDAQTNVTAVASFLFTVYSGLNVVAKINSDKTDLVESVRAGLSVLH